MFGSQTGKKISDWFTKVFIILAFYKEIKHNNGTLNLFSPS